MIRTAGAALAILLLSPQLSVAHRLDEYLQATRIDVARDRIVLEVDITPGTSIAVSAIASIDRDRDGHISATEAQAYADTVLAEMVFELDGRALPLMLTNVRVPALAEIREGMGTLRIEASADITNRVAGRHALFYRNNHHPNASVYLVNAMMPGTRSISIEQQLRDREQREFRLEYEVRTASGPIGWTITAALLLTGLAVFRTASPQTQREAQDLYSPEGA